MRGAGDRGNMGDQGFVFSHALQTYRWLADRDMLHERIVRAGLRKMWFSCFLFLKGR